MAKIYGTPIMAGGAGGANKDLPPLLDNFRAKSGSKVYIGEGNTISKLSSGSKIKLGVYNEQPLKWIVARDSVTQELRLVLDNDSVTAIGKMQFDAPEPSNPDGNRRSRGNNKYSVSNIHQWLNSDGEVGSWYTSAHQYDAAPDYATTKAGFLNEWATEDKSILQETNWTTLVADVDGDGDENFTAKISLMSTTELGAQNDTGNNKLDVFSSDEDRETGANYWTRTPNKSKASGVYRIGPTGMFIDSPYQASSSLGVRPICTPNTNTLVSETTDEDGCYTIGEDGVEISADKMLESRANELAGAVWVYGDHEPTSVNDGTKIQLTREEVVISDGGEAQTVTKTVEWNNEADFFARQFTYNSKKQYQTMLEGAIAKFIPSQSITELPSGSKVKLGTWNDTPLQWKVARDTSDQSIRLVLEPTSVSLLGKKMWDNEESSNSDSDRRNYGNNRYIYSNIHQWLNATKATGWYTAQHSTDAAPDYSSQAGFLSGWSENHIAALDRATLTTSRASVDGGGTETFVARVALISTTELGSQDSTGGGRLDIFNSDRDRATGSNYWTRTPYPSNSYDAYLVSKDGGIYSYGYSVVIELGVRPLCSPKSTALVSLKMDDDNCYTITGVNE